MKPTNHDTLPCKPMSSNCVIWQGPDIKCLKLCKGDSITAVMAKMATELCEILDMLNVDNYDLSCFGLDNCAPEDFQQLLQFIINQLCPDLTKDQAPVTISEGCEALDCEVAVEPACMKDILGNSATLGDYIAAMANEICKLVLGVGNLGPQFQELNAKVNSLETEFANEKAADNTPTITPLCVMGDGAGATKIDVVLQALEQQFCELRTTTGLPNEILAAIARQCSNLDELAGTGKLTQVDGWSKSATSAGAINNIWLTICDVRSAVINIQANSGNGCDQVQVAMTATSDDTYLTLFFTGSIPDGWVECGTLSQQLTITDCTGGMKVLNIGITGSLNDPAGYQILLSSISPPINNACNLDLSLLMCYKDPASGSECQKVLQTVVYNSADCPDLELAATQIAIDYTVDYLSLGTVDLVVEIWDPVTNMLVASDGYVGLEGPFQQLGQFSGLTSGKQYKVRTVITVGDKETICPWVLATTVSIPCTPPIDVTSTLKIT